MNIADLGTLLRIYDDLSPLAKKHLVGHLLQCTPATVTMLQMFHQNNERFKEFLERMHEFGIHPPGVVPIAKLPDDRETSFEKEWNSFWPEPKHADGGE